MTVLLIEHDMKLVSGICERLTVLNFGQVLAEGPTQRSAEQSSMLSRHIWENRRQSRYGNAGSKRSRGILWRDTGPQGNLLRGKRRVMIIALIGANGAGKTDHAADHHRPDCRPRQAVSLFEGTDITKVPGYKLVSMGIAHVPEGRRVFASL